MNAAQRRKLQRQTDITLLDVVDMPPLDEVIERTLLVRLLPEKLPWDSYVRGGRTPAHERVW